MTHRAFTPHLVLRPDGDGAVVLNAATLVPSGHFSAEPAVLGPPAGMAVVPEVFPVTLPLAYHEGVATQAFKLVRHGPLSSKG